MAIVKESTFIIDQHGKRETGFYRINLKSTVASNCLLNLNNLFRIAQKDFPNITEEYCFITIIDYEDGKQGFGLSFYVFEVQPPPPADYIHQEDVILR